MTKLISPAPSGMDGLPFGSAKSPYSLWKRHKGKDWKWLYANPDASRVTVAPIGGTVTVAYNDGGYHNEFGNYVDIQVTRSVKVRLAHHATGSVRVRVGQKVNAGDRIGTMGATGKTNGVHLHEELWIDGVRVNPDDYRGANGKHIPGTPVPAGDPVKYNRTRVTLTALNLRKQPSTSAGIIVTIPAGKVIKAGPSISGWMPVRYGLKTGWVKASFTAPRYMHVVFTKLALRTKPAPVKRGAKITTYLPKGKKVIILGAAGNYWRVRVGGRTGYVLKRGVK